MNLTDLRDNEYLPPKPCGLVLEVPGSLGDGTGWLRVLCAEGSATQKRNNKGMLSEKPKNKK